MGRITGKPEAILSQKARWDILLAKSWFGALAR